MVDVRAQDGSGPHRRAGVHDALDHVMAQLPTGVVGMAAGATLVAAQAWHDGGRARVPSLVWLATMLVVLAGEAVLLARHRRRPEDHDGRGWALRVGACCALLGALWGAWGLCTPLMADPAVAELVHLVVLCACAAGAVGTFAASRRLAFTYLVPMWALEVTALVLHGAYPLAAGSVVFAALIGRYTSEAFTAVRESAELRISEAVLAEQLRRSEAQARAIIDTAMEPIWSIDRHGVVLDVNPAASSLLGLSRAEIAGRSITVFLPKVGDWLAHGGIVTTSFEDTLVSTRGEVRSMMVSISTVERTGDGHVTVMGRDISERKALEERLAHEAVHDGLTGLPNRLGFFRSAELAIEACEAIGEEVAVIFVDLDRFKQVNDTLGHAAGDDLLLQTSERLLGEVRQGDLVARLGGDEFVLLLPRPPAPDRLMEFGRRLIGALERPFVLGADEARISASVGIASLPARDVDAHQLVAKADMAMYRAKQRGRRSVVVYDQELQRTVDEQVRLEQSFRRALERRQLEAWLQPIVDLVDGRVVGAELLTRWRQPDGGIVTPDVFIPLANEAGLTADLGRWVLDRAADLLEDWACEPAFAHLHLTVNISGRHLLTGTVADEIDRKLIRRGIDPARLVVELTETDLAGDLDAAHDCLHAVRRLGAGVAIDDFGTGYSSLAYLQELPATILKVDRRFVAAVTADERQATLVRAVVDLSGAFGLRTVAEGIETAEQAATVARLGCRYGQGWYFGRPTPVDRFERALEAGGASGADRGLSVA